MQFAWFVAALLLLFGVYSAAPIFGLDEAFPDVFRPYGPLSWAMVALVFVGAVWWGVLKVKATGWKKDPTPRDAMREKINDTRK